MNSDFNDPWLRKSLELTLYPTTGLRQRLEKLYEECNMVITPCTCHHPLQDHLHGQGRRVHTKVKHHPRLVRCTVCGTTHHKVRGVNP